MNYFEPLPLLEARVLKACAAGHPGFDPYAFVRGPDYVINEEHIDPICVDVKSIKLPIQMPSDLLLQPRRT